MINLMVYIALLKRLKSLPPINVAQAFRPDRISRPKGLHYDSSRGESLVSYLIPL